MLHLHFCIIIACFGCGIIWIGGILTRLLFAYGNHCFWLCFSECHLCFWLRGGLLGWTRGLEPSKKRPRSTASIECGSREQTWTFDSLHAASRSGLYSGCLFSDFRPGIIVVVHGIPLRSEGIGRELDRSIIHLWKSWKQCSI